MADPIDHEHDLEDHIRTLRKLDLVRKRSAVLRDEGIDVLMEYLHPPGEKEKLPVFGDWLYESPLIIRALLTRHDQPLDKGKEKTRLELIKSLVNRLQKDDLTLEKLAENELSVLVAANILRTLTAKPGAAFSKTAMLCYYWIIRELYSADRGDWSIGGARAAPGGLVTAFTTGECIRALLSFADALRNTGEFVAEAGEYSARKEYLAALNTGYFPDHKNKPLKEWVEAEEQRLRLSYSLKLRCLSRYRVLSLVLPDIANPDINIANPEDYLAKITSSNFEAALEIGTINVIKQFEGALGEILKYRCNEYGKEPDDIPENLNKYLCEGLRTGLSKQSALQQRLKDVTRSESAHLFAVLAVRHSLDRVRKVKDLLGKRNKGIFKKIKQECDEAADEVYTLLHPVRNYLSSVLDRELELVSLGENWDWQPCELACAAASYGKLTKEWEKDTRFSRAVSDLSKMVSSRGRFANPRHFHEQPDGIRHLTENAVILRAMAQLLHHACDSEIETGLADNMLRFFEDTRARQTLNVWSFSAVDITSELITKLGGNDPKAAYIRGKLPQTGKLLELIKCNIEALPKEFTNSLARRLAIELNELIQAHPFVEEVPIEDNVKSAKKELAGETMEQDEKFSRLLNRLCLQNIFPEEIRKINVSLAVKHASSDKKGWVWELSLPPFKTDLAATASAVMALAKINEMLDARINHIILEHFSVKRKNKGLDANLTLDSLFYPDYGLLKAPKADKLGIKYSQTGIDKKDWPEKGCWREKSVAIVLQQMRAHVSRLSLPKDEPLYSLVLHGPAGTGKTTLVEALAVTCDVPLVEVTPSDLVKHGEENIETRARAVFEALSMLTRTVILFDEFDPVLKRRDAANNNPLSVFSFLTPGMLPKLKDLHDEAKRRSVAYVLVTNLIGELDEAAVRQGRFDERLGIYPPDLLSRVGRFLDQISPTIKLKWKVCTNTSSLPPGIEVIGAPGSANGKGELSLVTHDGNHVLTWKPFDGNESTPVKVTESSKYELPGNNKDNTIGWLFVMIDKDKLSSGGSTEITISDLPPDSTGLKISNNLFWVRFAEVINKTAGKGMTALGKLGWFTRPGEVKPKTPFGYVLGMERFDDLEPDDDLKGIRGEGRTAVTECLQWTWINAWDKTFSKNATHDNLPTVLNQEISLDKDKDSPIYVQSSRDKWEVMVGRGDSFEPRMLIQRSRYDTGKKPQNPSAPDESPS